MNQSDLEMVQRIQQAISNIQQAIARAGMRDRPVRSLSPQAETPSPSPPKVDFTQEFNTMKDAFLQILRDIFTTYEPDSNYLRPTQHLNRVLKQGFYMDDDGDVCSYGLKMVGGNSHNTIYKLGQFSEQDYLVVMVINDNGFTIQFVPSNNIENTPTTTNISVSSNLKRKMYTYGIKANGLGPRVRGGDLNKATEEICNHMHIPQLFISDEAGISCYWDNSVELEHFSVLRVIAGNGTFYESSFRGHFYDEQAAMEDKEKIKFAISKSETAYVLHYLNSIKKKTAPRQGDNCQIINRIIRKAYRALDSSEAIFHYVAEPYRPTDGRLKLRKSRRLRRPSSSLHVGV